MDIWLFRALVAAGIPGIFLLSLMLTDYGISAGFIPGTSEPDHFGYQLGRLLGALGIMMLIGLIMTACVDIPRALARRLDSDKRLMKRRAKSRLAAACSDYRIALKQVRRSGVVPSSDDFSSLSHYSPSQARALARMREVQEEHRLAAADYERVSGRIPSKYKPARSWQGVWLAPDEYPSASWGVMVMLMMIFVMVGTFQLVSWFEK